MPWVYLILAGCFECGFTTCLKLSNGLQKPFWSVVFVLLSIVSFVLVTIAAQKIPLGTAYAVWTGIGAAGTAAIGIIWFKDPSSFWRLLFLATLIGSIIGLKLVSDEQS